MAEFVVNEIPGIGSVAVPQTSAALGHFLALQRSLNAIVAGSEWVLPVDGRIGPKTLTVYNRVAPAVGLEVERSITSLATHAEYFGQHIAKQAGVGYDTSVPQRPPTPTSTTTSTTSTTSVPGGEKKSKTLWWVLGGVAAVGVIAIGVSLYRRRRSPAPARRRVVAF